MIDYLLKIAASLGVLLLVYVGGVKSGKAITPDSVIDQVKDDTPAVMVTVTQPTNRIQVEPTLPGAVFSYPVVEPEDSEEKEFLRHTAYVISELRDTIVYNAPEFIFPDIDRSDPWIKLDTIIHFPTEEELSDLYDEELFRQWNEIQSAVIVADDFKVRALIALPKGEFANILANDLERYRDVLDATLEDPQKFWLLISEYEIVTYLELQQLNQAEDIPASQLKGQIMTMMERASILKQKELWQDSPLIALYLFKYN